LLTPSLQATEPIRALPPGRRPWHISSLFYPAFFGGALAVAALAWENSVRLGTPASTRRWIAIFGISGIVASVVASYVLYGNDYGQAARLGYRVVGAVTFGVLYRILKPFDRLYAFRTPAESDTMYDKMWGPGLLAVFGGGLIQLGIVFGGMAIIHAVAGS